MTTNISLTVIVLVMAIKQIWCSHLDEDLHSLSFLHMNEVDDDVLKLCEDELRLSDRKSRHLEITSSILQLIYSIIGKTGHSPKSLELARQMNVSKKKIFF